MQYLFACAIGPVQDFIATARRSRDLWVGSWLLSELSKAAVKCIVDKCGMDSLIFPKPENEKLLEKEQRFNVPNKVLAVIEISPDNLGDSVEKAIRERLSSIQTKVFDTLPKYDEHSDENEFKRLNAENQMSDLIEYYWAAVPYSGKDYANERKLVEALLASRKNTRDFRQVNGDYVPKSSLDGNRESVIDESCYYQRGDSKTKQNQKAEYLYKTYKAKLGERLSGVDLIKRLAEPESKDLPKFYSTSHYAAVSFMDGIGEKKTKSLFKGIRSVYKENKTEWTVGDFEDGSLLFESRLADSIPDKNKREEIRKGIEKAFEDNQLKNQRPTPYYVLLRADGDNMGKVIDYQNSIEKHQELSKKISEFAGMVNKIVSKHGGETIYSGGEDILAYLPLHKAIECAVDLDEQFKTIVDENKFYYLDENREKRTPSLSVGLVIAHHLDSLSETLEMSKTAEKEAKKVTGKNGLAIVLCKRSGVDRLIVGKLPELSVRLNEIIELYREKAISKGTAYEFQRLLLEIGEEASDENLASLESEGIKFKEILSKEALRILKRKRQSESEERITQKTITTFEKWIKIKEDENKENENKENENEENENKENENEEIGLSELVFEMIIANEFASAFDMAKMEGNL